MKFPIKGSKDYLPFMKKYHLIKTIGLFLLPIAIYYVGYTTTHTKANLLTIIAVLGFLPASKSAVSLIMFLKTKAIQPALYEQVKEYETIFKIGYQFAFTSEEFNMQVPVVAIRDKFVYCLLLKEYKDYKRLEQHLVQLLKQNKLEIKVLLFTDEALFIQKLSEKDTKDTKDTRDLKEEESSQSKEDKIMHQLSLLSI